MTVLITVNFGFFNSFLPGVDKTEDLRSSSFSSTRCGAPDQVHPAGHTEAQAVVPSPSSAQVGFKLFNVLTVIMIFI